MGKARVYHHSFAVGVIDKATLPRTDLAIMQLAAEQQTNLMATTTGKGFFRPGFEYLGATRLSGQGRIKEFVFSASDACLLEFTDLAMRVWEAGEPVTRLAVDCTIVNGDFGASAGWTDASTDGATAVVTGGFLELTAAGRGSLAAYKQQVTTLDPGVEHGLRIEVERGPVTFRCGINDGGDEYVAETVLKTGTHSLAFTPTGSFWVYFQAEGPAVKLVSSITIESAGVLTLTTPWGLDEIPFIRTTQSADVVFVASRGRFGRRIERRGTRGEARSWSLVMYHPDNGPFTAGRTASVRLKADVTEGNGTLLADRPFFRASQVGSLFKVFHTGQTIIQSLSGEGRYTDPIEVTGINNMGAAAAADQFDDRAWAWEVAGTWVGTLKVFRSFDGPDFGYKEYRADDAAATIPITANGSGTNTDEDSNAIVWYRIGFDEGDYTSGTAEVTITYAGGGGAGVCRITSAINSQSANIEVLKPFRGLDYSDDWQEGAWSGRQSFPSAVALFEGRLWWAGADKFWGSVSDDFENFDEDVEGDSGPISRVLASNGVNDTQWMLPLQRLILGTEGTETSARSSSFDEPLTPTNLTLKDASTVGSAPFESIRVDTRGLFIDRSGRSIFEITVDAESADYAATELTRLCKDTFAAGLSGLVVQRRPDTRIWAWLVDGTAVCIVYEPKQNVVAFIPIETDGLIESMAVLPGSTQDMVYAIINRDLDGPVRCLERMAVDAESRPGTLCKVLDSSIVFTNAPASATVTGLIHLAGQTVRVWADGAPITETVNGREVPVEFVVSVTGEITLPEVATTGVVGLPYQWRYKSARLAYGAEGGTSMLQEKRVDELGIIMTDFARAGIRYGREFDDVNHPTYPLPSLKGRTAAPAIVTSSIDDEVPFVFDGDWNVDSRVCIEGESPFPASLLGMVLTITTNG